MENTYIRFQTGWKQYDAPPLQIIDRANCCLFGKQPVCSLWLVE